MFQLIPKLIFHILLLLLSVCTLAKDNHQAHSQSNDYQLLNQSHHVHGVVELTVALVGDILEISLESPASNIVGFEHQAQTDEEVKVAMQAKKILETSSQLFTFIGSGCKKTATDVDLSKLFSQSLGNNSHSEIHASYTYKCLKGEKLMAITVNLASYFDRIENISSRWITEDRQGAVDLTANANQLQLR
jgi:hypothetical protein